MEFNIVSWNSISNIGVINGSEYRKKYVEKRKGKK